MGVSTIPDSNDVNALIVTTQKPDNVSILISSVRNGRFCYSVFHCNSEMLMETVTIGKTNASIVAAAKNIADLLESKKEELELAKIAKITLEKTIKKLDLPTSHTISKRHDDHCIYFLGATGRITISHSTHGKLSLAMSNINASSLEAVTKIISHIRASNVNPKITYDISGTAKSTKLNLTAHLVPESLISTLRAIKRLEMLPTQEL
jgi:hypothetical protein